METVILPVGSPSRLATVRPARATTRGSDGSAPAGMVGPFLGGVFDPCALREAADLFFSACGARLQGMRRGLFSN
jgi:hypothetical protein